MTLAEQLSIKTNQLHVRVDTHLTIDTRGLPDNVVRGIKGALQFPNPEREEAEAEKVWGWEQMPETIMLWHTESEGVLRLPRGFAAKLKRGMARVGFEVFWDDQRADGAAFELAAQGYSPVLKIPLRPYQKVAVDRMLQVQQGVWKAPPGAGKTVGVLGMWAQLPMRTLVIVNKLEIMQQWSDRFHEFFGVDGAAMYGDGEDAWGPFTIAMQQTLWSRREDLQACGFFDLWGCVVLDECHHLPANTFTDIMSRFPAKYRFGVSGTPARHKGMLTVVEACIGEVFHETPKQELIDAGVLRKPRVEVVQTGYTDDFWPTHENKRVPFENVDPHTHNGCAHKKICTRNPEHKLHRNNYGEIIGRLIGDLRRNEIIACKIVLHLAEGRSILVLSDRLAHLAELERLIVLYGIPPELSFQFTGAQSREERAEIIREMDNDGRVMFSTVADEALDIPRLDTLHLAFPSRNPEPTKQKIGRIEREHPDKRDPLVVDYVDDVSVFRGQFSTRRYEVYKKDRLEMTGHETLRPLQQMFGKTWDSQR